MENKIEMELYINQEIREQKNKRGFRAKFENLAPSFTRAPGSSTAFLIACVVIISWALTDQIFRFSDTWQLVINTGTTIVTFLMIFLIQQSQNKAPLFIQFRLNELIACEERASNRLIDVEDLTQEEPEILKKFNFSLSVLAEKERDLFSSHPVDEATDQHQAKTQLRHKKAKT